MKRRILLTLLTLCLVLGLALSVSADGGDVYDSDAVWNYENGVLTISGEGRLLTYPNKPWSGYLSEITTVVVEDGITSIDDSTFIGLTALTKVTIADSVTDIGEKVFYGCSALTDVKLPANLVSLGTGAFTRCTSLTEITLPDTLTALSNDLFSTCSALVKVNFPANVTTLGDSAFRGCGFTELTLPEGITAIGKECFGGCSQLAKIDLPSTLTTIGAGAFNRTKALKSIVIPGGVTEIPERFFEWSNLEQIAFEEGVEIIGRYAFDNCQKLTSVTLPSTLTHLNDFAFDRCKLTDIDLPDSIQKIGKEVFRGSDLTEINLPEGLESIGDSAFGGNLLTELRLPSTLRFIGMNAFVSNPLTAVEFSEGLEIIDNGAFSGTPLVEVHLPEGLQTLGDRVFQNCASLTTVTMPDTVIDVGNDAFRNCTSLTSIRLSAGIERLMPGMLQNTNLPELEIPYGVEWIYNGALDENLQMTKLVIPATVTYVEPMFRSMCYNALIHCQKDTYIQRFCDSKNIEYKLIDDYDFEESYPIHILTNMGGTVTVSRESSPALRYITLDAVPRPNWALYAINIYSDVEGSFELQDSQLSDTRFEFMMPPGEIWIEVLFVSDTPFKDVPKDAYYYEPVMWAVHSGITSGTTADTFEPYSGCNRSQVVTFLWRAAGEPEPISTFNPFTDVKPSDYYYNAVLWAVENGITNGLDATHFGPYDGCNRSQVVTFLWRTHGKPAPTSTSNPFADVADDAWYLESVLWAVENGITNGLNADRFGPDDACDRSQVVTFLYRDYMNIE